MPGVLSWPYRKRFMVILTGLLVSVSLVCTLPRMASQQNSPPGSNTSGSQAAAPAESVNNPPVTNQEVKAAPSGQILILPGGEPPTLDPHLSGDSTSAEYLVEIFSGLMTYDPRLNLIPDVAESYQISTDGLVYTFKLRPEAKFQDGKPVRAQDFKWSFERACDPATQSYTADTYMGDIVGCRDKLQGQVKEMSGVKVVDDLTLQVTIDAPKSFFLAKMAYPTAYALDRENVESGGPAWFAQPNGSGPFKLAQLSPNLIVLKKNDAFYRNPQPTLAQVFYLINTPVDPLSGYEHGLPEEIIATYGLPDGAFYDIIPVSLANFYRATDPHNALSREFMSSNALSVSYISFNVKKPPFDDVKVRQAFNLALDKPRIVKLMFRNTTPIANGIVPPGMPGYQNPSLPEHQFDPTRARQLLAESKYGGKLPPITLNVSNASELDEAIVKSYETNLGLNITVEESSWRDFLTDLNQPEIPFQMYELGWIADYPDPQNFLEVLFHSTSAQNHGGYNNPQVDALLDEARGAPDTTKRVALYQQAEKLILDDAAWIPLTFDEEQWLVKSYVKNYQIPPMRIPNLQYITVAEH